MVNLAHTTTDTYICTVTSGKLSQRFISHVQIHIIPPSPSPSSHMTLEVHNSCAFLFRCSHNYVSLATAGSDTAALTGTSGIASLTY